MFLVGSPSNMCSTRTMRLSNLYSRRRTKLLSVITTAMMLVIPAMMMILLPWTGSSVDAFNLSPQPNLVLRKPNLDANHHASYFGYTVSMVKDR